MGGPNQKDVGLFMRGISNLGVSAALDTAPPTFSLQQATVGNDLGGTAGDLVFTFDSAITDAGTSVALADFVLKTGTANQAASDTVTDPFTLLPHNNVKFTVRPGTLMLNSLSHAGNTVLISGVVSATIIDAVGNTIVDVDQVVTNSYSLPVS
jgi:hypothetical protein